MPESFQAALQAKFREDRRLFFSGGGASLGWEFGQADMLGERDLDSRLVIDIKDGGNAKNPK